MKNYIAIFLFILTLHANALPKKLNAVYLNTVIAASKLTIDQCDKDQAHCVLVVMQKEKLPLLILREYWAYYRDLQQAYYNAAAAEMFNMRTNFKQFPGSKAENLQMLARDRRIFGFPGFEYNNAAGPLYFHGRSAGSVGVAVDNDIKKNAPLYYDYFMKQFKMLSAHPKKVKKIISSLEYKPNQRSDVFSDVLLSMMVHADKLCRKLGISCSFAVTDPYGTLYGSFSQINAPTVTPQIARERAATVAAMVYPRQWDMDTNPSAASASDMSGFNYVNRSTMIPLTGASHRITVDSQNRPFGGIGVGTYPTTSTKIYWQKNNKALVNDLWQYLMAHYRFIIQTCDYRTGEKR